MPKKNDRPLSDYEDYQTYRGEDIRIYAVPQQIIRGITPTKEKPKRPFVIMIIKGGNEQKRPAKQGDPEWDIYQEEIAEWEQEQDELQEAVTFVMALRDYLIPDDPTIDDFPNHIKVLINTGLLRLSSNVWLRKLLWIRSVVLGQHDEYNINLIIQRLSGVPEDIIEEMKRNFRNILLGQTTRAMGSDNSNGPQVPEQNAENESLLAAI